MNEKRVEGYDGCPEQTVRSDVIPLNVRRLLDDVAEHSIQISLRENYCINVPEQNWSLLLTAVVLIGQFWGLWSCGAYTERLFRKARTVCLHPPSQIDLLKPTGYVMHQQV